MANGGIPRTKHCTNCGGNYLLDFCRRAGTNGRQGLKPEEQFYRDRCIGCEAVRKRGELIDQRLRRKAITTRRRHGANLKELGRIKDKGDLEEVFGWSLDRMISDIQRIMDKGCPYCLQPVNTADEGFGIITLDILNADQAPHYSTNVVWCCARCNSRKTASFARYLGSATVDVGPVAPESNPARSQP
jgi:hypothetical protein